MGLRYGVKISYCMSKEEGRIITASKTVSRYDRLEQAGRFFGRNIVKVMLCTGIVGGIAGIILSFVSVLMQA